MSDFKFWGWDKKPRTMLRFVKPGDVFCFRLNKEIYCFGRIVSKITMGHVAEIFDFISKAPNIAEGDIYRSQRLTELIILDTYTLFDKKLEVDGDWRIIGHQDNFTPTNVKGFYFSYGIGNSCRRVDVFNNEECIEEENKEKYFPLTSRRDMYIKELVGSLIK